ncbi:MAG TPA: ATP-binding cassette domain-containing protein [Candidatus Binataceae bacterium]|nr:ATP-binding cassette domain-containing protein [Candidatus Binataceae bacterium]
MSASTAKIPASPVSTLAPAAIEADAIGFRYGERVALDNVGFTIARGEMFAFLGPNGGGKTTLFKLLSTLVPMQSGRAAMLGHDLAGDTIALRRIIGVVFQHPSIDGKLTVAENLACHGHLYGMRGAQLSDRIVSSLDRMGIADRKGDLVETLSGGLRRRAELAKALIHRPELLLLDEPSTGLDPAARRDLLNHLAHLRENEGVTVVLTTHHMEEAERCARIGILHQGKLVASAPPAELKARVGGDVVTIGARAPELLQQKILQRMKLQSQLIDGEIRIERPRGHELVRDLVEAFGSEIESVSFGRPTLEDVFAHLTGHRFFADQADAEEGKA